ncbi:peptidoglycan recognition protein family protein [Pseudonocardia asaccharolytica]|uniref:N-acetylmuramoyl-L-alanine amidase n=1 Tax=Pseudonocardia asaccharolytica DSM 44247 = NBRC 16224 TaxID=1123024 RepID=A0A511D875_9PSEU|nr:N-acetylmuramoyl-L-alanine amidase [Pseudonocardia asaccharolytica]GEL20976.1 N-acetylmuramoyl-L-alanine amidase [Pseudonocardia asaccharolytica DSM 44247 = NBRC 16224]
MARRGVSRRGFLIGGLTLAGTGLAGSTIGSGTAWALSDRPIIDCAGWGARPNSAIVPIWNQRPVKILVHHTATPNVADQSRRAADSLARAIQNFHMDVRGWLDTGQHFTISRGGFVLEGRHRSLEVLRIGQRQVEGAHCTGQNVVAVGIENEGTYLDVDPPGALWDSLRALCVHLCSQYGIPPTEIYGHRDFKNTACPGDRLYGMLPRLRTEVAGGLGQRLEGGAAHKESWPLLRPGDRGPQVQAAQYLLRAAGMRDVVPSGRYDRLTAAAVLRFQELTDAENVGMIGGETWPVLARPVRRDEGGDAERAVAVLAARRGTESVPDVVTPRVWQRLLGTGGAPAETSTDPQGPPR